MSEAFCNKYILVCVVYTCSHTSRCLWSLQEELVVFEARLAEARKERLAVRKKQRQEKHRAESEATRKAEEEERSKWISIPHSRQVCIRIYICV